jgi:GNAT superfamily N-acetyltransferase
MVIRPLSRGELSDLLALYQHLHMSEESLPEPSVAESVWEEISTNPRYRYTGAYCDGILVCSCALTIIPNLTRGCRPYGIIENVVTHSEYRRKGFGKAVLGEALSHAWSQGCYKVMLLTGRKDDAIFRFYEAAGFDSHAKQAFAAKSPA